jgi:hypothetical protein
VVSDHLNIEQAIAEYQPAWLPEDNALRSLVVSIDPCGGGSPDPRVQRLEDLALLTACHLYHLVRAAGGVPVLTRADQRPAPATEKTASAPAPGGVGQGAADLSVLIEIAPGGHGLAADVGGQRVPLELPNAARGADGTLPGNVHRHLAECIYRHAARFVQSHRDALQQARRERESAGGSAQPEPVPWIPGLSWEQELIRAARRIWPEGTLPAPKAGWFCDIFARTALSDRTTILFEPQIESEGDAVLIGGATDVALLQKTLKAALSAVGVKHVAGRMRLLPEDGRLHGRRFAVCAASMALTFDRPAESAAQQSQLLGGEPLLLLDHDAGYYLVHGSDGYWGWVRDRAVRLVERDEFRRIAAEHDRRRQDPGPDGPGMKAIGPRIIADALALLHRPYVFGGVSELGLDCSGLVRNVCARAGLMMARNAAQQFLHGRLVATRWYREDIAAGDLLYFVNTSGRIFHVGIALSDTHFVHCAPPEVKINSLRAGDRLYSAGREQAFLAARRLP